MNRLDIVNQALNRLGQNAVANIDDDNTALLLDQTLISCLNELAMFADWYFLTEYDVLSKTTIENPTYDWTTAYQMPPNFKKVVRFPDTLRRFQIMGSLLLTNDVVGDISLYYIKVDPQSIPFEKFSPEFSEALSYLMASKVALPVTENNNILMLCMDQYKIYRDAALFSNQMINPNYTAPNNTYERVRE